MHNPKWNPWISPWMIHPVNKGGEGLAQPMSSGLTFNE
jgi:hypothetical protein